MPFAFFSAQGIRDVIQDDVSDENFEIFESPNKRKGVLVDLEQGVLFWRMEHPDAREQGMCSAKTSRD
ncbi:hypothetical protein SCP_1700290 [Sparassis crispa]|uniref:Uncharacterized protein n=1 Tax=Sparassis crispa TaxID=139825 RepID=A0A401H5I9_9APHY|nr:hypothetical protein SCP_1700290 [Sparassis crispa]GBE89705.1 hypothetical protein SCP_1700290 [Sparassis crispa]